MNKYLLLFLFVAWSAVSYSQAYQPIAIDNAHWRVAFDDFQSGLPYDYIYEYFTNGDTVYNSFTYKKVYNRQLQSINNNYSAPYSAGPAALYGLLRDDVPNQKSYSVQFVSNGFCQIDTAVLFFDFNLQAGDSIPYCRYVSPGDTIVDVYISFEYGANRRIQEVPYFQRIIEGVGSNLGLFEPIGVSLSGYGTYLENYCVGSDANCDIVTSITNEIDQPVVQFDQVNKMVLFNNSNKYNLRLFNSAGMLVWKEEVCSSSINLPADIPKGLYVLQVYGGGEKVLFKFVN